MAIFRTVNPTHYTIIDRKVFESTLSYASRGLLVTLLSKPDWWNVCMEAVINEVKGSLRREGRDAIYKMVGELIVTGFIARQLVRDEVGRFAYVQYDVFDYPLPPEERTDIPDSFLNQKMVAAHEANMLARGQALQAMDDEVENATGGQPAPFDKSTDLWAAYGNNAQCFNPVYPFTEFPHTANPQSANPSLVSSDGVGSTDGEATTQVTPRETAPVDKPRKAMTVERYNASLVDEVPQRRCIKGSRAKNPSPHNPARVSRKRPPAKPLDLPAFLDASVWKAFVQQRRDMKKPLGRRTAELLLGWLDRAYHAQLNPNSLLQNALLRGWTLPFAPKTAEEVPTFAQYCQQLSSSN